MSQTANRRYRCAEYFGADDRPRVTVDVGNDTVFMVWGTPSSLHCALYSEQYSEQFGRNAIHVRLTPRRAAAMIKALVDRGPEDES